MVKGGRLRTIGETPTGAVLHGFKSRPPHSKSSSNGFYDPKSLSGF